MFKKHILAVAFMLVGASTAMADTFSFNPTGTGPVGAITNAGSFDQKPGNALAQGGGGVILAAGQKITVLYQANLGAVLDDTSQSNTVFTQGQGGRFFTFVAGYGEQVTSGSAATAGFSFDATNPVNFFKIYASSGNGDNLSGANFTSGTVILSGVVLGTGFSSSFNVNLDSAGNPQTALFDGFGVDNYAGYRSIIGGGGTNLTVRVNSLDANYFPDLTAGSTLSFFSTTQATPFNQVDPSRLFINNTGTVSQATTPNRAARNGASGTSANDFQLQADASSTFTRVIPEPDSLLLLGLGLGVVGFLGKRRKQAA